MLHHLDLGTGLLQWNGSHSHLYSEVKEGERKADKNLKDRGHLFPIGSALFTKIPCKKYCILFPIV